MQKALAEVNTQHAHELLTSVQNNDDTVTNTSTTSRGDNYYLFNETSLHNLPLYNWEHKSSYLPLHTFYVLSVVSNISNISELPYNVAFTTQLGHVQAAVYNYHPNVFRLYLENVDTATIDTWTDGTIIIFGNSNGDMFALRQIDTVNENDWFVPKNNYVVESNNTRFIDVTAGLHGQTENLFELDTQPDSIWGIYFKKHTETNWTTVNSFNYQAPTSDILNHNRRLRRALWFAFHELIGYTRATDFESNVEKRQELANRNGVKVEYGGSGILNYDDPAIVHAHFVDS